MSRIVLCLAAFLCAGSLRAQTVLILPFWNLSESPNVDWIGESIAETVREGLTAEGVAALDREIRQDGYHRLSLRPSARLTKATVTRIGEALDADLVVFGEFEAQAESGLSITAHVVNLQQMKPGPVASTSGRLDDLAELQNHLAWRILAGIAGPGAAPSEEQFLARRKTIRLDVMENYIRGLAATDDGQKHRYFAQAARLDPGYSQPCYQLGRLRLKARDYGAAAGWLDRLKSGDPHFREARFLLGVCRYHLGDYRNALADFRTVLEYAPSPAVWNNLGAAQSRLNLPVALGSFERALEAEPDDPVFNFNVGYALWRAGEYDEAAESFRAVLDRTPEDSVATTMLGRCLKRTGPRGAETKVELLERLKPAFDERGTGAARSNGVGSR